MSDNVVSPSHYQLPSGFQVIDLTKHMCFCSGNVVKYTYRAGKKDGESKLDDLKKASRYLNLLISDEKARIAALASTTTNDPAGIRNWGRH